MLQNVLTLLDQVGATGAGASKRLPAATDTHAFECFFVDADTSITVLVVDIEVSFDPAEINDALAKWYQAGQHTFTAGELTAKQAMFVIVNIPALRIRANITTLTGADANDKVTVRYIPNYMGDV